MMKRKSLKVRILSLVLAAAMASGTVVSAAETEKASGLAGVGNWFAEHGKDIKGGAVDAGDWMEMLQEKPGMRQQMLLLMLENGLETKQIWRGILLWKLQ